MRHIAVLSLLLLAAPAYAQDYGRSDIIRGLCQKDGCDEFSVSSVDRVRGNEDGVLLRTRIRTYRATGQGRTSTGEEAGYVFCSATNPTILAESDGRIAGLRIATAPTQESRETVRQQANYYAMYFTMCHGPDAGRAAVRDLEGVAQRFGYRSPLPRSEMITLSRPDEVFSRPSAFARVETPAESSLPRGGAVPMLPPRPVPNVGAPAAADPFPDRRRTERLVDTLPGEDDREVVILETPRRLPEASPWYRTPQRWIESLNPF